MSCDAERGAVDLAAPLSASQLMPSRLFENREVNTCAIFTFAPWPIARLFTGP